MQIPKRVIDNATIIWKAVNEALVTLESALEAGTNAPVYFICVGGVRLARMVTAADSFYEPMTVIYPAASYSLLVVRQGKIDG